MYNHIRPHWALLPLEGGDPLTPADVYVHGQAITLPKWQGWAKAAKAKLAQMMDGAHFPVTTRPTVQPLTGIPVSASASGV